jgi:hypothetical protein
MNRVLFLLLLAACGGSTASTSASSSSGDTSSSSSSGGGRACTEIACQNGVLVDFSYTQQGAYVVEVTIDGAKTTCRATLPLPRQPPQACDREGVQLTLSGSALPASQHSIGGLTLFSTSASSVTIRATRDGNVLGEKTFAPAYTTSPGPNGPGCDPAQCKLAKTTFP